MKYILIFIIVTLLFTTNSCEKYEVPRNEIPKCIREKIKEIENNCLDNVYSYDYNGETVYLFNSIYCGGADMISAILCDNECTEICFAGGISGSIFKECSDFLQTRTNEKLIWQKK